MRGYGYIKFGEQLQAASPLAVFEFERKTVGWMLRRCENHNQAQLEIKILIYVCIKSYFTSRKHHNVR